ncbi:MAG: glutamine amidotransferase family protein [Halieaceae bacterium]|jgi:amidophosphoribosyltransferase|nr:glutamine amidotransferase family protein [Halieaceae bacterium]
MCGIVGLFLKDDSLAPQLGDMLSEMLVTMTDRGPDSAGIALYGASQGSSFKVTVQSDDPANGFSGLAAHLSSATGNPCSIEEKSTHAVISTDSSNAGKLVAQLRDAHNELRIMATGERMEIYKEVGLPKDVAARFNINQMSGTHGIGHTRMATESAITTMGAHPFSTGADQCLVHNGSLSNHNSLRRSLRRNGVHIETENDSEVAAAYLTHRMNQGRNLGEALEDSLDDLDGFFTFVVGTKNGFGVLRDPIACKPAVMAETDRYVAFGSEYRALVSLPSIDTARVWEPEPANVYFWER